MMRAPLFFGRFLVLGLMLSAGIQTARADGYYGTLTGSLVDDLNSDGLVDLGDSLEFSVPVEIAGNGRVDLTLEFLIPPEQTFSDIRAYTNKSPGITVLSGDLPGDTSLKFDFGNPIYFGGEETAVVFFRVHVGFNTPPDTTLSVMGTFTYPDFPTDTNNVSTDTNIVSFDIVGGLALAGIMRSTPWLDQGFIGVMEAGESMTYSTIVTNTGFAMSNVVLSGLADANTRLIAGSVNTSTGTILLGNGEKDTEVRIALDSFPVGATAAFSYAVTFPAAIAKTVTSVTGRALLADAATDDPYLVLKNVTPFGPVVRLVAVLSEMTGGPIEEGEDSRQEKITITNEGPVDVTGVTVQIKGLGYSIRPAEPVYCPSVAPRFCREDGTSACAADEVPCMRKPELGSFVYPGLLKVGESFTVDWPIKIKPEGNEIMTYQLDMTSTTTEAKPRPFEVTMRLQRVLVTYDPNASAISPWAALLALITAAAYLARKKKQAA